MQFKRKKIKNSILACLSLTMCATFTASCAMMNLETPENEKNETGASGVTFTDVTDKFDTTGLIEANFNSSVLEGQKSYETRTVIVYLEGETVLEAKAKNQTAAEYVYSAEGQSHLRSIDREQRTFLNKLSSQGIKYKLKSTYSTIANAVAVEINTSYVKKIKSFGGVESAVIGNTYLAPKVEESASGSSLPRNDANVYNTGIYNTEIIKNNPEYADWAMGDGKVVAILDTGLDYTHPAFQRQIDKMGMTQTHIAEVLTSTQAAQRISALGGTIDSTSVYVSDKVPYAFDYADNDFDVYPSYSNHGTHVAGIVGGYDENGYDDKDGNHINELFTGVAPNAQLVICKTFTDNLDDTALGGAESENIMSALEDCVTLGVDVINMSLGTTAGFTTTNDGDDEGEHYDQIFESIRAAGISLVCAASNDYSSGYGSVYGTNLSSNPDSGTVGSPSTYFAAMSVASISGQESKYLQASDGTPIFVENASNGAALEYDFVDLMLGNEAEGTLEYVVLGTGQENAYSGAAGRLIEGRIALITRGINTFQEKVQIAASHGASGVLIYNNVAGSIRMSLGDLEGDNFRPSASITMDAGEKLVQLARSGQSGIVGTLTLNKNDFKAGPFMSEFSCWGSTSDLKIKPEITAHGGEITSTVPGGYGEQSGTSMAAPNMAGLTALVRSYVETLQIVKEYQGPLTQPQLVNQLTNQLIMSTASTVYDQSNLAYSPRKQGAGLASLENIVGTNAYLFTDESAGGGEYYSGKDGRPKIELGDDDEKSGVYSFSFKVRNFGDSTLVFTPESLMMTETRSSTGAVAEKAYMLEDVAPEFSVGADKTPITDTISVPAGQTEIVNVTLKLSDEEKRYIDSSFENGMYVEGFIKLGGEGTQCDLSIPFLAFYGDWEAAPMLDYTAFELAANQQDASVPDEDKLSETVWATQPYGSYNQDNYIIPMGSFVYTLADGDDPMYADEEHIALSRFNEIVSEDGRGNYATVYEIRCVYAGLLRNAQKVNYKLYDAYTGECIYEGETYRISKAYANGGTARPAYLELRLDADELGLMSNGKYRFDFEFLLHKNDEPKPEDTFSFNFYVDYEAPELRDARVRYLNTTDANNRETQRIFLDLDVFDNHYAQSVMLCYVDEEDGVQELKLATDYATPVRNANRNGTTTVSVEVTDIWDEYKDRLAVQIDDYALNHSSYILGSLGGTALLDNTVNRGVLPDTFELAEGEENITVDINEMHKVSLEYEGNANLSNFEWASPSRYIDVKNGEIVGVQSTNGKSYPVLVSNRKGVSKTINVTVTDTVRTVNRLSFSFGTIVNANEALQKAQGSVPVYAGEDIQLEIVPTPWYYKGDYDVTWRSGEESVATVSEDGLVHTKKRGSSTITATVVAQGIRYSVTVNLVVRDEFTMNGLTLTRYRGEGETRENPVTHEMEENVVVIPEARTVMAIGEDAFRDNTKIQKIIIPKTVTQIDRNAFRGCTNLKSVYFMSDDEADYEAEGFVPDSDLSLINRNAFDGCTALETLDLRYTKVFSIGREAFKDCVSLKNIIKSTSIGTAYERAFMGCSSLEEIDISGLHVSGANVFSGCTSLKTVTTDTFTAIGNGMFSNLHYVYAVYNGQTGEWEWSGGEADYAACNSLEEITINCASIGNGAFANCTNLASVTLNAENTVIGGSAFEGCTSLSTVNINGSLRRVGANAFAGTNTPYAPHAQSRAARAATVDNDALINGDTLLNYFGNETTLDLSVFSGVTKIGAEAFANSSVQTLIIPETVTEIGESAFRNSALQRVTFSGNSITQIAQYAFANTRLSQITLPSSVSYIGDYAFAETPITSFTFNPAQNAVLGNGVFRNCTRLENISLAANITQMGDYTFGGCTELGTVSLPALTALGAYTFINTPNLSSVTFAEGASVTGTYTFAAQYPAQRRNLTSVTFANGTVLGEIGEGAFYNCANLTSINLCGAKVIGNYAFYNNEALSTVTGLSGAETIGDYAFADCHAFSELNLTAAKTIGEGAFQITSGRAYTVVNIPVAETLGAYAFQGGNERQINIPNTLTKIGIGAFANSSALQTFEVAEYGNEQDEVFFVDNGALYRNILGTEYYGLVAYPSGLRNTEYTVLDNTARIEGLAFSGLSARMSKVILPYTLKSVGAMAFYQSGITQYEFKGVTAPTLETDYSLLVNAYVDANNINFRGYYYANFQDFFIYYSHLSVGDVAVTPLTIFYPENGTGFDNNIYSQYFAEVNLTAPTMNTNAFEFAAIVDGLSEASEISGWNTSNKSEAEVREFSDLVRRAHGYYNTFRNDETQLALVGNDRVEKLTAVETALRQIKPLFNISVSVSRLRASGNYRTEYRVGESFDMTGLQVIVEYDDYSSELADMSQITLDRPTGALTEFDNEVVLRGYGRTLRIVISVTENGGFAASGCNGGGAGLSSSGGTMLFTMTAAGAMVLLYTVSRKKYRGRK